MSRDVHHIANLNALPEAESEIEDESSVMPTQPLEDYSVFSNTTFYDFDIGRSTNIATTVDELLMAQERQLQYPGKSQQLDPHAGSGANSNNNGGAGAGPSFSVPSFDFPLHEFSLAGELPPLSYESEVVPQLQQHAAATPAPQPTKRQRVHQNALSQRHVHNHQPEHQHQHQQLHQPAPQAIPQQHIVPAAPAPHIADTSSPGSISTPQDLGDGSSSSRNVAEEDKRRRNTAASARFRIKKKLREQEMERNSRDMQRQIDTLAARVKQLEMENRLLKNLAGEQNEARDLSVLEEMRKRMLGTLPKLEN